MNQAISDRPDSGLAKAGKTGGLVIGGTTIAALMIAWVAFLLWLAAEAGIAALHWL